MERVLDKMFAFICNECGYGLALNSGVILQCPMCKAWYSLMRASHEEYHNCETNDGKIKEECPRCRGKGEIMIRDKAVDSDGSEDIGGTPYPEGCPRCKGEGVIP